MNASAVLESAVSVFSKLGLFIDGTWNQDGCQRETVINPATEQALGTLPHASNTDLAKAVAAAQRGFAIWSATPARARRRVLMRAAALIRERSELLACIMTLEEGKPAAEAKAEIESAAEVFDWYAEEACRLYGRVIPSRQPTVRQIVQLEPVGPVAAFTPWNFPALTPARKIAGALAAGCSCVIKASEETPATCSEIVRACVDADLPPGVLNLVFGVPAEISGYLLRQPAIRKVTFTGSIDVGEHLATLAASHGLKRCTMELGGHAPAIVFDDYDAEKAAEVCATGRFRNAGQVCVAPSRFYVQRKVYDRFAQRFTEIARELVLGDGFANGTQMGPLANQRRLDAMQKFVSDAVEKGARLLTGGRRARSPGFFWEPTVLSNVPDTARVMAEETFGPIVPIAVFDTVAEVLERANSLQYGLAAYAFTNSATTSMVVSDGLAAGMVGVNHLAVSLAEAPFGGVKESGYGSEGGSEGLSAYLTTKFITHAVSSS